jgi:hypothetical protein
MFLVLILLEAELTALHRDSNPLFSACSLAPQPPTLPQAPWYSMLTFMIYIWPAGYKEYWLWFTGLGPTSEIRDTVKQTFRKLDSFPSSGERRETPALLGSLERELKVGVLSPSPEGGKFWVYRAYSVALIFRTQWLCENCNCSCHDFIPYMFVVWNVGNHT